jgi:hypothetical protein
MPAIVILYETVEHAIRCAFARDPDLVAIMPARMNIQLPLEEWADLRERMRGGWLVSAPCESAEGSDKFFTA